MHNDESNGAVDALARAEIRALGEGAYGVTGPMTFHSVAGLWRESRSLFKNQDAVTVDLDQVTHTDSAGLALLVEWRRNALRDGYSVKFLHLPAQMIQLAGVTNLGPLLDGNPSAGSSDGS